MDILWYARNQNHPWFQAACTPGRFILQAMDLSRLLHALPTQPLNLTLNAIRRYGTSGRTGLGKRDPAQEFARLSRSSQAKLRAVILELGYFWSRKSKAAIVRHRWKQFQCLSGSKSGRVRAALARCGLTSKHIEIWIQVLQVVSRLRSAFVFSWTEKCSVRRAANHLDVDAKGGAYELWKNTRAASLWSAMSLIYDGWMDQIWILTSWLSKEKWRRFIENRLFLLLIIQNCSILLLNLFAVLADRAGEVMFFYR